MPLELSPSEESCVMDHMEIFEKNGFRFSHDPDKAPRHRLSLTALPHSGARDGRKAVQFGKEDVSALCAILGADGSASSYDGGAGGGTGADGSGMYGNNAVRRYAGTGAGDTADKIIARLPKAIAMFASRACRGSIMIGKPLSIKEMDRIVRRLEDVEHPWNCPHGRPTMRHVGNVAHIMLEDEKKAAGHIAGPTVTVMSQEVNEES
jgi:DNA mismatch repair protein PMS2